MAGIDGQCRRGRVWTALTVIEVCLATAAVVWDLWLPTLVLLALAGISLAVRRERPATLGFHRLAAPWRVLLVLAGVTILWTVLQVALLIPVLEHLTGQRQDVSQFAELEGNLPLLLVLLALSWTLAAVGEETAYRGYVLTRFLDLAGRGGAGVAVAVVGSSVLFGLAHTEQGLIGVVLTFADAVLFSVLRLRFRTLWAPVLAHGLNNTLGLTAYFLVGPIYGLW